MTRRYSEDIVGGLKRYLAYVSPGSVQYWPEDIALLIPWLFQMREGVGPADPKETEDAGIRGSFRFSNRNEAWCEVAAEIDTRLAHCHEDRLIVERYVSWLEALTTAPTEDKEQQAIGNIGRDIHREAAKVRRDINSALSYIASGPCPRYLKCEDCGKRGSCKKLREMEAKGKKRKACTYEEWKRAGAGRRREK